MASRSSSASRRTGIYSAESTGSLFPARRLRKRQIGGPTVPSWCVLDHRQHGMRWLLLHHDWPASYSFLSASPDGHRVKYFPRPEIDRFHSGNRHPHATRKSEISSACAWTNVPRDFPPMQAFAQAAIQFPGRLPAVALAPSRS